MPSDENLNLPDDIKEVKKRSNQFILLALSVAFFLAAFNYFFRLFTSFWLAVSFELALFILICINKRLSRYSMKITLIILICLVLIIGSRLQGVITGLFLYFFALLIIIPSIVEGDKKYSGEFYAYLGICSFSALLSLLIGIGRVPLEIIKPNVSSILFYLNFIVSFSVTILFTFLNTKFEKNYISAIYEQKNKAILIRNRFMSIMGHELRTPLNGIIGATNILKQENHLSKNKEYIEILSYCSNHMLLLVNDILDFNKIESGKLEIHPISINLKQMLLKFVMPFYNLFESKNLELSTNFDSNLDLFVFADDLKIVQVLNNLLSNALKFTKQGQVTLEANLIAKSESQVSVKFVVKDTGIGIEDKFQKLIFESFWQIYDESNRDFTGTGIGLTICIRILELMNSNLNLESKIGEGSCFSFILNMKPSSQISTNVFKHSFAEDLKNYRILLVEDNQINILIAKKILSEYGSEPTICLNGEQALKLIQKNPHFDIILLDLEMPVMNGYQAVIVIKELLPEIPVLAFTASLIDDKKLEYLQELGFTDCVLKPYQPLQLLEQIKKYVPKVETLQKEILPASSCPTPASTSPSKSSKTTTLTT